MLEYSSPPLEFRFWMKDTEQARQAFYEARQRLEDFLSEISHGKGLGFTAELPRVDQYFCAGPRQSAKVAMREGKLSAEVRTFKRSTEQGSEEWEKKPGSDMAQFTRLPWVSLWKSRSRCKAKKAAKNTPFDGLKALELTEVHVVPDKIDPAATASSQPLKSESYLTIAIEGTEASIKKVIDKANLEVLKTRCLKNPEGQGKNLYQLNVSYPRFINIERA